MRASLLRCLSIVALAAAGSISGSYAVELPPASQMKPLGIIGGTSWHSTVEYYRYINQAINDRYGNETNPPLIVYNLNQEQIHVLQDQNRWSEIANTYVDAALKLQSIGAQGVLFAANTPHKVYTDVAGKIGIPILHIGDATGIAIKKKGLTHVGLIGTTYTMDDGFMQNWLHEHYQIEVVVPRSAAVKHELQRIIQKELGMGIFRPEAKRYVLRQIEDLEAQGVQGVILGCTEFPLIISQADVRVPLFDTTRLHAEMAVDFVLGH
ncbi:MAG: amino acid racemase [Pseudomonadota bacterium]|nr:amino acid racemase [Pseudomonadota bacterium]